jgi:hypothetical protein
MKTKSRVLLDEDARLKCQQLSPPVVITHSHMSGFSGPRRARKAGPKATFQIHDVGGAFPSEPRLSQTLDIQ